MTSRDRITKTFNFQLPDRVGICDDFTDSAVKKWKDAGKLPKKAHPQEYFDFDIRLFGFNQDFRPGAKNAVTAGRLNGPATGENLNDNYERANAAEKFLVLSCVEPFEHVAGIIGREKTLAMMAEEANKIADIFADSAEFTLKICQLALDKGYRFDGAWVWGDLGCKAGLIFSTDYYNALLFDLHKEFCDFFSDNSMPVIFHSDGNIRELLPHLIEAGVRAIEPLESDVGMDLAEIKKEYGKDIVLFGGIDEQAFTGADKADGEIKNKFRMLMKNGGYIYHTDSPISEEISFENYKNALELVKKYGVY
ncbi:MAG: uroporphyrinogen decarboxylase family protein [Candidatus Omnitrophica bacterium]|nr:uroporphyrinogen decarboxylase family protein [Candidatus Omnitrophota bacterium]